MSLGELRSSLLRVTLLVLEALAVSYGGSEPPWASRGQCQEEMVSSQVMQQQETLCLCREGWGVAMALCILLARTLSCPHRSGTRLALSSAS